VLIGAFGDPGHAFPAIALGRELSARGHDVTLETWSRLREHAERAGMRFVPAPEYQVFPTRERPLKPYAAAVRGARTTRELVRELQPDVVVNDVLTLAATLAAEMERRPRVTVVPHLFPLSAPRLPPFGIGARPARTTLGRMAWRALERPVKAGLRRGRSELNEARRRLGLPPIGHPFGGISRDLCLVATFPQLEYPREQWEPWMKVTGPLLWEQPYGDVEPPTGDEPLVLIAPSTSQDPPQRMLRAALEGLADEPVRVLASTNRQDASGGGLPVPPNARLVDWVSYSRTMPLCDAVVCHAGHGTVARALSCGVPLVACPAAGDMAENTARVAWAGVGVGLPKRLTTARGVRLAVRKLLADPGYKQRAEEIARWSETHDGAAAAADELERFATRNS
jgi:MGT family glycosyltransferase